MGTPHKYADVIKAWADGADIQYKSSVQGWVDMNWPSVQFFESLEYRVKPKKVQKKRWFRTYREGDEIKLSTTDTPLEVAKVVEWPPRDWVNGWSFIIVEVEEEA